MVRIMQKYGKLAVSMDDTHLEHDLSNGEGEWLLHQSVVLDGPSDEKKHARVQRKTQRLAQAAK